VDYPEYITSIIETRIYMKIAHIENAKDIFSKRSINVLTSPERDNGKSFFYDKVAKFYHNNPESFEFIDSREGEYMEKAKRAIKQILSEHS